jgi:hypothetical protein
MYLSAERWALANNAVVETFEKTSIAWQIIPHWDTPDPGQMRVSNGIVNNPGFSYITHEEVDYQVTLVQTYDPTAESLIAEIVSTTTALAVKFDGVILDKLRAAAGANYIVNFHATQTQLLDALIDARAKVEDPGFRAPSCLITNTAGLKVLSALDAGYPITDSLLDTAHVNSLNRTSKWHQLSAAVKKKDGKPTKPVIYAPRTIMVMLGRRQLIPHTSGHDASSGEEPVDLAVSVPPSLEIVGEAPNSRIYVTVRIRYALRIKERPALVALYGTPVVDQ